MWSDTWVIGDRTAELETIVVAPAWRGGGVGKLLMDRVEAELEELGIKDVIIGAMPSNFRGSGELRLSLVSGRAASLGHRGRISRMIAPSPSIRIR